jgi:hypothetical protein
MTRVDTLVLFALATASAAGAGCRRSGHARLSSYARPALPAGFVERAESGWHAAAPSTWAEGVAAAPALWQSADPQAVDDYRANASVVRESFAGESFDYARANESDLRAQSVATVLSAKEDVIDGDPTLIIESRWQPPSPSTPPYELMQSFLASRGNGYVITCGAAANSFERYRSTCEAVIRSFAVER